MLENHPKKDLSKSADDTSATRVPFYQSIKTKALSGIFLIAIIPLILVGYYSHSTITSILKDILINSNMQALQQAKSEINNFVQHYADITGMLREDERLKSGVSQEVSTLLRDFDSRFEFLESLMIVSPDGTIEASSGKKGIPTDLFRSIIKSDSDYIFQSGSFLIKQSLDSMPGSPVLVSRVSFYELKKQLDRISQGTTFRIYLASRSGMDILLTESFPSDLVGDLLNRPYGAYEIASNRGEQVRVATVLPVLRFGLRIIITQEAGELYSVVGGIRRNVFALILLIGTGALLAAVLASRRITAPIVEIAEKANEISEGNLSVRVDIRRKDEIGFLARSFNNMARRVLQKIFELSALFQISQIISHAGGYQEILDKILVQLIKLFGARRGSIMILTDEEDNLLLKSVKIYRDEDESIVSGDLDQHVELKFGEGIAGQVVKTGIPVLSIDCKNDRRFKQYDNSGVRTPKTLISVPLVVKDRPFGVINLSDRKDDTSFTTSDMELLLTISTQMAISLDNSKLYEMAIRDGLTNLYIYRYFQIRLEDEIVRARRYEIPLSLMMIDIDNFKMFNDTYGHQQGDIVLRETAQLVQATVRSIDVVCRYGGEEFAVILPSTSADQALILAERLRKAVENHQYPSSDGFLSVNISIGIAEFPAMAKDKGELVSRADVALYSSKNNGRNKSTVYSTA